MEAARGGELFTEQLVAGFVNEPDFRVSCTHGRRSFGEFLGPIELRRDYEMTIPVDKANLSILSNRGETLGE